jgi:hypothetical protein
MLTTIIKIVPTGIILSTNICKREQVVNAFVNVVSPLTTKILKVVISELHRNKKKISALFKELQVVYKFFST